MRTHKGAASQLARKKKARKSARHKKCFLFLASSSPRLDKDPPCNESGICERCAVITNFQACFHSSLSISFPNKQKMMSFVACSFAVFQEHDGLEAIAHKAMIMVHRVAHATTQFKRDSMRSLLHSAGPAKTFVGRDKRRRLQDFTDGRRPAYANFRCLHYIRPSQQRIFA